MAQLFAIHPDNPQERLVKQVAGQIKQGKILVLPTDACYVLCCHLGDKTRSAAISATKKRWNASCASAKSTSNTTSP